MRMLTGNELGFVAGGEGGARGLEESLTNFVYVVYDAGGGGGGGSNEGWNPGNTGADGAPPSDWGVCNRNNMNEFMPASSPTPSTFADSFGTQVNNVLNDVGTYLGSALGNCANGAGAGYALFGQNQVAALGGCIVGTGAGIVQEQSKRP